MKSNAQVFIHNKKEVVILKLIEMPPGANVHYSVVNDGQVSQNEIVFYVESLDEFASSFIDTGHSVEIDTCETVFWKNAYQDAQALRFNPEAWVTEKQERQLWESLDSSVDNKTQDKEMKHKETFVKEQPDSCKWEWETKSSGQQQNFGTGAKRDIQQGKGRFDLIPPHAIMCVAKTYATMGKAFAINSLTKRIGFAIECLYNCTDKNNVDVFEDASDAMWYILEQMEQEEDNTPAQEDLDTEDYRFDLIPYNPIKRVADVYERGANLYGERNWEHGMPLSRLLDSAIRHLWQYNAGKTDEDHAAQGVWNIMGFIETLWRIQQGYLPKDLDNRLELKKIDNWPLDFDGDEGVGNGKNIEEVIDQNHTAELPEKVIQAMAGRGLKWGGDNFPMWYDGYNSSTDEKLMEFIDGYGYKSIF